jgi:ceramide glucosyltransferase
MILLALKVLTVIGCITACGFYVGCIYAQIRFTSELRQKRSAPVLPAVSLLKPLCGTDPHAYESLRSHCVQDYPEFEIIFGVRSPDDTALGLVDRLRQEFPSQKLQLVVCPAAFGTNFKVSNLIQMLPRAAHNYILVNDSDIHVPPDYLRHVMAEFEDGKTGLVTCLYRGIGGSTLGSRLEALGINTDFIPGVLLARKLEGGMHFGLGSTLAFPRSALLAIGGFESIADYLGDDYELGRRIAEAGYEVRLAKSIVGHYIPEYPLAAFVSHQMRWARTVRDSRPGGFAGLAFTFGLFWAIAALLLTQGAPWMWALLAITVVLRMTMAARISSILGDSLPFPNWWLLPFRDLLNVVFWAASYAGKRVVWRGNQFTLENGKLRS